MNLQIAVIVFYGLALVVVAWWLDGYVPTVMSWLLWSCIGGGEGGGVVVVVVVMRWWWCDAWI